ncbi:hypothetical protein YC2023_022680 [Brassica napus]
MDITTAYSEETRSIQLIMANLRIRIHRQEDNCWRQLPQRTGVLSSNDGVKKIESMTLS